MPITFKSRKYSDDIVNSIVYKYTVENKGSYIISNEMDIPDRTIRNILSKLNLSRSFEDIINNTRYLNNDFFENINTEEKAYWLGFILADGCVTKDLRYLILAIKDKEHLNKFSNIFNSNLSEKRVIKFENIHNIYQTCIGSKKIVRDFRIVWEND